MVIYKQYNLPNATDFLDNDYFIVVDFTVIPIKSGVITVNKNIITIFPGVATYKLNGE